MLRARGARQIVNGVDVRLGIELTGAGANESSGNLIIAGFARLQGTFGPLHIERVFDEDGSPLGYGPMSGASLLYNADQEKAFNNLPKEFTFKQAKQCYGRADQATSDFLKKCASVGILRHEMRRYIKSTSVADNPRSGGVPS